MILNHDFSLESKRVIGKAHCIGVCYKFYPAAAHYAQENRIYYADIRYAMKRSEVLAAEKHIVPGLMRYWVAGKDTDRRTLTMVAIIGDYPLIEIEKLIST